MNGEWSVARVFISSTFRDMHAERDHLVRFVFSELKELCRKIQVRLIDVDLRWGVTEKDVQDGKALDICLDEIDSCRPFFLGILGERYGFVPPGQETSITAQEIYHGVLHDDLPSQVMDLKSILESKTAGTELTEEEQNCLIQAYRWDGTKGKYILQIPSESEKKILQSIFRRFSIYQKDRSFFFFRSEVLTRKLAGNQPEDFYEPAAENRLKLLQLKQQIKDSGLPFYEYEDLDSLGEKVLHLIWTRIQNERKPEPAETDWLQHERELHRLFIADRIRRFVGRRDLLNRMLDFAEGDEEPSLLMLTGQPGSGKSSVLAQFAEEASTNHPDWLVFNHFVGASPASSNLPLALRRLCSEFMKAMGEIEELSSDMRDLVTTFATSLKKAAAKKKILIILDGVNQFEQLGNLNSVQWIPQILPPNTRMVISTLPGSTQEILLRRATKPQVEELKGLSQEEIQRFVREYLSEIRRQFPNPEIEQSFHNKVQQGNPLYVLTALEELRVFGDFEQLSVRIEQFPKELAELLDQVLMRIENDFDPALVGDCLSLLACGRHGMTADELQELLSDYAPSGSQKLPDMIWARLKRSLGPYLFDRSGVFDFFHSQMKESVLKRYLIQDEDHIKTHRKLADYFESRWKEPYVRALEELPYQLTNAMQWERLGKLLSDLKFIETKFAADRSYDLISDYSRIGAGRTRSGTPQVPLWALREEKAYCAICVFCGYRNSLTDDAAGKFFVCQSCHNRMKCSQASVLVDQLPVAQTFPSDVSRRIQDASGLEDIEYFADFVLSQSHVLNRRPDLTLQQAANRRDSSVVCQAALQLLAETPRSWLHWHNKIQEEDPCVMTLSGHQGSIRCCKYSPDARRIVSASNDKTCKVWDTESGTQIVTFEGHTDSVLKCIFTPDGRRVISASQDKTIRCWDAVTAAEYLRIETRQPVVAFSLSPLGTRIAVACSSPFVQIFDLATGEEIETLSDYKVFDREHVEDCFFSHDGLRLIASSQNGMLRIWDLQTRQVISTFQDQVAQFGQCRLSPDGKTILTYRGDWFHLWNEAGGIPSASIRIERSNLTDYQFSPDGEKIISAWGDGRLQILKSTNMSVILNLIGHRERVLSCDFSPDGEHVVSGGVDSTLKAWSPNQNEISPPDPIEFWSLSPDGSYLASATSTKAKIEQLSRLNKTSEIVEPNRNIEGIRYSPDGKTIALCIDKRMEIRDGYSLHRICSLGPSTRAEYTGEGDVLDYLFAPDGKAMLIAAKGTGMYSPLKLSLYDVNSGKTLHSFDWSSSFLSGACFSPDSSQFAAIGEAIQVWSTKTGKLIREIPSGKTTGIVISPDGRCLCSIAAYPQATATVSNMIDGKEIVKLQGHEKYIKSCAFSPDGRTIGTSSTDRTVRLWNTITGEELKRFDGDSEPTSVKFLNDSKHVLCGFYDGSLKVWRMDSGQELFRFVIRGYATNLALADGGRLLVLGNQFRTVERLPTVYILTADYFEPGPAIVTAVRFFHPTTGSFDSHYSTNCGWCGKYFTPEEKTIDCLLSIVKEFKHWLDLPERVWVEPDLAGQCPHCIGLVQFNPYLVDHPASPSLNPGISS